MPFALGRHRDQTRFFFFFCLRERGWCGGVHLKYIQCFEAGLLEKDIGIANIIGEMAAFVPIRILINYQIFTTLCYDAECKNTFKY